MKFPDMDRNNIIFTVVFYAVSVVRGTAMSVLAHVVFVWALVRLAQGKLRVPTDPIVRLVAVVFALYPLTLVLSSVLNDRGLNGLWEAFEQVLFLSILPIYARLSISDPREVASAAVLGAAIGTSAMAVISVAEVGLLGVARAHGGFSSPGALAHIATVLFGLLVCLGPMQRDRGRLVALVGVGAAILAILLSGTRSYWVLVLVIAIAAFFTSTGLRFRRPNRLVLVSTVVTMAVFSALAAPVVEQRFQDLVSDIERLEEGDYKSSLGYRIVLWTEGKRLAEERPLLGYGPDAIDERLAVIEDQIERRYNHFHSFVVTALVQGGVVLLLVVLCIPVAVIYAVTRASAAPYAVQGRSILLMLIFVYYGNGIIGGLFGYDSTDAILIYSMIVGLFLLRSESAPARPDQDTADISDKNGSHGEAMTPS